MNGSRVLEVHLAGDTVRALTGSMVAYEGSVTFKHSGISGGGGLKAAIKRKVTGESLELMEMTGNGIVYCAANATEVELVELQGDTLHVESSSLLALDGSLRTDVAFAGLRGASSGQGLFTTTVTGMGTAAVLSDGPMIALEVSPQFPLVVDPDCFIAHRGQLQQSFVTDISWKTMIGEGSGENYSLSFQGSGVVYIQPAER
ncbi:AIM24 family protein [Motilibacter peucedani]